MTPWAQLRRQTEAAGPVIRSQRGGPMTPVSIVNWFAMAYRAIGLQAARPILAAAPSSPGPPGWSTMPVPRCETFSSSPVTGRSRPLSGTSTATPTPSASSCR